MKKTTTTTRQKWLSLFTMLTLFTFVTLSGCKDDDKTEPMLKINKAVISFVLEGGNDEIQITSNQDWTVSSNKTWITLNPDKGRNDGTVTVTVGKNTEYELREATLTVSSGAIVEKITVSQPGLDPALSVNPKELAFEVGGGTQTVTVTANVAWTPSVPESDNWITLVKNENTVSVTATPNTTAGIRTVKLALNGDQHKTDTVVITQNGPTVKTIAELRTMAANAKTDYIKVTGLVTSDKEAGNISGQEMFIQDANGNAIALQFKEKHTIALGTQVDVILNGGSKTLANGLNKIEGLAVANIIPAGTATITADPKEAALTAILAGEVPDGLLIKISGVEFKNADGKYNESPVIWNGEKELGVSVSSTATFAGQKVAQGNGPIVGILNNTGNWQLALRNTNDVKNMTAERMYDQPAIILSPSTHTFSLQGGSYTIGVTVKGNIAWTASVASGGNWCTLEQASGTGSGSFIVTAGVLSGTDSRSTTITVSGTNAKSGTLEIKQLPTAVREFALAKWSDTNLGATLPATEENMNKANYKDTYGLFYQWGRNVGFPYTGATATVPASADITAEQAQKMPEFITSKSDWLTSGAGTAWRDRAGSLPCPAGYHLPTELEITAIYPSSEALGTFANTTSRNVFEKLEDRPGMPDKSLYVGDGTSKLYAIKYFGLDKAYVLRWEVLGEIGSNLYLKITEIHGDADTYFDNAGDAEKLFSAAMEKEVRIFPVTGMLNGETGALMASGTASWHWADKKGRSIYVLNTTKIYVVGAQCGYAQPIRCLRD